MLTDRCHIFRCVAELWLNQLFFVIFRVLLYLVLSF